MSNKLVIKSQDHWYYLSRNVKVAECVTWKYAAVACGTEANEDPANSGKAFFFNFSIKSLKEGPIPGRELLPEINFSSQRGMCMSGQAFANQIYIYIHFFPPPLPVNSFHSLWSLRPLSFSELKMVFKTIAWFCLTLILLYTCVYN